MIIIGIDPGWRNFSFFIANITQWDVIEWENLDMLPKRKSYSLQAMKKVLREWYCEREEMLKGAVVVIEKQIKMRYINITLFLAELMPHATILDIRGLKKHYGISTGKHSSNKKAIVGLLGGMLPPGTSFKRKHNLLDSFLIAYYYASVHLNAQGLPELVTFSNDANKDNGTNCTTQPKQISEHTRPLHSDP